MTSGPRVTVISGGSRGLGRALVEDRLKAGDVVATYSRTPNSFINEMLGSSGTADRFYWEAVDGVEPLAVGTFAKNVLWRYKRIDTLINNAGVGVEGLLTTSLDQEIRMALALNLEAVIVLTRACLKGMLAARSGCVINISSVNAIRGHSGLSIYSATKAALLGFTQSLAREVGPQGIRINSIAPGVFESDMVQHMSDHQRERILRRTPLKALCTIQDLVECTRFLLSCRGITGQTVVVDGGLSC